MRRLLVALIISKQWGLDLDLVRQFGYQLCDISLNQPSANCFFLWRAKADNLRAVPATNRA